MESFYTAVERLGVPTGTLLFLGAAIWIVLKWLGNKVILPISESHISLVNSTKEMNALNAKTLDRVASVQESKVGMLNKIVEQNDQILDLASKSHELLDKLRKGA